MAPSDANDLAFLLAPLLGPETSTRIVQRAALACATACAIGLLVGPLVLRALKRLRTQETIEKSDSAKLAELSKGKRDTPTMGGILFLPAVGGAVALFGNLK